MRTWTLVLLLVVLPATARPAAGGTGRIEGTVLLGATGDPLPGATVTLVERDRQTTTDENGVYQFEDVPPGKYFLKAHVSSALTQESGSIIVAEGQTATVNFKLRVAEMHEEVTVTATGRPVTAMEAIQATETRNSFQLAEEISPSLGETLANRPGNGIAKRSFGPGTGRPIIRGFDGNRVLVMQDGISTGSLSSQSGDHGELVNTADLDRIEIVRGPASLMYGGSAVGGVVNTISRHHSIHEHAHPGLRGHISGSGGSANAFGSGSASVEYGEGHWMIWGGGSGQASGDYSTPEGKIPDSDTRLSAGHAGFGHYGDHTFLAAGAQYNTGLYGIPFAAQIENGDQPEHDSDLAPGIEPASDEDEIERIALDARLQNYRLSFGRKNLRGPLGHFILRANYSRWLHDEVEHLADGSENIGTSFDNKQFIYRGTFEQTRHGPLTGRFGLWGMFRNYDSAGEEALSPKVDQRGLAGFVLEELNYERVRFEFGARLEHTGFDPGLRSGEPVPVGQLGHVPGIPVSRGFTGFSAAAGANFTLWKNGAFVANYTHSYRPPALEELYNFGPHTGNLAFEIGDPALGAEQGNGLDLSLRHANDRFRFTGNFFYYDFSNFIFPFATGEFIGGLQVIQYTRSDARFLGSEINGGYALAHDFWLNLGLDYVDAEERATHTSLPRIPPLRGRAGLDWHYKGLEVKPEIILANRQSHTFTGESETAGYTLFNIHASYTFNRGHLIHQFAVNTFNLSDRLYRNHSSFIKNLAPEIGRGVRFTYSVRFF